MRHFVSCVEVLSVLNQTFGCPCLGPEVVNGGLEKEVDVHYWSVKHDRRIGHRDMERNPPQNRVRKEWLGAWLPWRQVLRQRVDGTQCARCHRGWLVLVKTVNIDRHIGLLMQFVLGLYLCVINIKEKFSYLQPNMKSTKFQCSL